MQRIPFKPQHSIAAGTYVGFQRWNKRIFSTRLRNLPIAIKSATAFKLKFACAEVINYVHSYMQACT